MPVEQTIKTRRGTAALWTSVNPILAVGECGLETDTLAFKYGDGVTAWSSLDYASETAESIESKTKNSISGESKTQAGQGSDWEFLTEFRTDAVLTNGQTANCDPGASGYWNTKPGTVIFDGASSAIFKDGVMRMQGNEAGSIAVLSCNSWRSSHAAAVGKAAIFYINVPKDELKRDPSNTDIRIGWTSEGSAYRYVAPDGGITLGGWNDDYNKPRGLTTTASKVFQNFIRDGDQLGFAVEVTAAGFNYYVQGGLTKQFGCEIGSSNWFPIGSSAGTISGSLLYPAIYSRSGTVVLCSRFGIVNSFRNDGVKQLDYSASLHSAHVPSLLSDGAGGCWAIWQIGSGDSTADISISCRWRNANGVWTGASVVRSAGSGSTRYSNPSISRIGSQVWAIYSKTTDAWTTQEILFRVLSVSGSTITVGGEQSLTSRITSARNDSAINTHALTLPSGRILLSTFTEDGSWNVMRSDNGGTTWALGPLYSNGGEVSMVLEGGKVAAYIRTVTISAQSDAVVWRAESADNGATFGAPSATAVTNPSARFIALSLADGGTLLIGNEFYAESNYQYRPKITAYILAAGGAVLRKIPLADFGHWADNDNRLNYPDAILENGVLTYIWGQQTSVFGSIYIAHRNLSDFYTDANQAPIQNLARATIIEDLSSRRYSSILSADFGKTSSTAYSDSGVSVYVPPGIYSIRCEAYGKAANSTGGHKAQLSVPENCYVVGSRTSWRNGGGTPFGTNELQNPGATIGLGSGGVTVDYVSEGIQGTIIADHAMTIKLQYAQNASSGTTSYLAKGSYLILEKIQ